MASNKKMSRVFGASLLTLATLVAVPARHAGAEPIPAETWVTNGVVDAMVLANNRVYIGGDFTQVGPNTGGGADVDAATGTYNAAMARIDGTVNVAVSDGASGWFIGGDFSFVDGLSRPRLAHVNSAGQVTAWRPAPPAGQVNTLLRDGNTLYVGGDFTEVLGTPRQNLAAVDVTTENAQLLAWNPGADAPVVTMAFDEVGTGMFLGGDFAMIGAAARSRLAHVALASGSPSSWNPGANATVRSLSVHSGTVYVGGDFTVLGGVGRASLGALDSASATPAPWNPGTDGTVAAIAVDSATAYVGGDFATAAGAARSGLAAISTATGAATAWNPAPDAPIEAVGLVGADVVVGGAFLNIGGVARQRAARITAGGVITSFDPGANGDVGSVAVGGSRIYLGGSFSSVNGVDRPYLAALDATTGVLDVSWAPVADGRVRALEVSSDGSVVFAGGAFVTMNGTDHRRIAALNATTGVIDGSFVAQADNQVRALHEAGGVLYLAGDFGSVSSNPRSRLAALDEVTGAVVAGWDPAADDSVRAVASSPDGSLIYVGGMFDVIDGMARNEIAAIETATGNVSASWNPNTNRRVYAFEVTDEEVLVAMGGAGGRGYSFDPVTGAVNWFIGTDGDVQAVTSRGDHAYFGGHFLNVGPDSRDFFFAADLATGSLDSSWQPQGIGGLGPFVMRQDDGHVWAGGEFTMVEGRSAARVMSVDAIVYTAPGSYRDRIVADAAVAYYRLGESSGSVAVDSVGVLDGAYQGGVTHGVTGLIVGGNSAVSLDGAGGLVAFADSSLINIGGPYEERTIEVWFSASNVAQRQVLFEEGGATRGLNMYIEDGSLYFGAWNTSNNGDGTTPWAAPIFLSAPVAAGQTYLATLVFDFPRGVLTAYVNGVAVAESAAIGRLFAHADNIAAGGVAQTSRFVDGSSAGPASFGGTLDELAVYNSALAEAAVMSHYLLGATSGADPAVVTISPDAAETVMGTVTIQAVAEDRADFVGTLAVDISVDGGSTWNPASYVAGTGTYDVVWDTTLTADGPASVIARATDSDTNQAVAAPVNVLVDNDNDSPVVSIVAPADGASVAGITAVEVDASDVEDAEGTLDVAVRFDDGAWQTAVWNAGSGRYIYSWDTATGANGPVVIEARAVDSAIAESFSQPVAVTVENPEGYPAEVLADNPVIYWRFDESSGVTAFDEMGAVDATYRKGATVGEPGLINEGSSVELEGVDDYVRVIDTPLINTGTPIETRSIELWFAAQDTTNRQVLFEEGGYSRGINIYIEGGRLYFGAWNLVNDGDGTTPWVGGEVFLSTPITTGPTYHVVMTFDQPTDQLIGYLDGLQVVSRDEIGRLYAHNSRTGVGAMINRARFHTGNQLGHGAYFDGRLDELAIYDSVLTPGRVAAHHAAGI